MKNKWMIPVVLFLVLIATYFVRGMFTSRIGLELLQEDKIEEFSTTQGVLIKTESVNTVTLSGATEIYVKNGDRVSNKEIIAMLYSDTEDESLKTELAEINKKIAAITDSNSGSSVFINDTMKMEAELAKYVDEVITFTCDNNLERLSEYKYKMSMLAEQKAVANGEKESSVDDLSRLQSRKYELEKQLGRAENVVSANMPGIFVEGRDGFEETLKMESVNELTPDDIRTTINEIKNGEVITDEEKNYTYRIVDNYSYMVALNLDKEFIGEMKTGDSVIVRFTDFSFGDTKATVEHISQADNKGQVTVVVKCDTYVAGLMEKRVVNVDFVKNSVSGYKVSIDNIHTEEESVGLYIKRGAVMRFIPINIIYSNGDDAIVSSADSNQPIKAYDEVVTAAPEFRDGRVIVSQ